MPAPVIGLVLAAGAGTRLGLGTKALLPFRGRPLIEHILRQLLGGGCTDVSVVLGAEADRVLARAQLDRAGIIVNPSWGTGLGSSFSLGVAAALADHPGARALLVALGDQPGVSAAVVGRLAGRHQPGRITAAGYRHPGSGNLRRGHPLVFDPVLAAAAAETAEADAGARAYLHANPSLIDVVDCSDLADGLDVDTPADLPLLEIAANNKWQ